MNIQYPLSPLSQLLCKVSIVAIIMALASCSTGLEDGKKVLTDQTNVNSTSAQVTSSIKISSYQLHSCALMPGQGLKCWGDNSRSIHSADTTAHVGDIPTEMGVNLPLVNLGGEVRQIAVGRQTVCGLLDEGILKCWGKNSSGQLGQGNTTLRANIPANMGSNIPTTTVGSSGTITKIIGGYQTYCAIMSTGGLRCWGLNNSGQLGLGHTNNMGDNPGEMATLTDLPLGGNVLDVSIGYRYVCALISGGKVKCWGWNTYGQLGQGVTTSSIGSNAGELAALPAINLGSGLYATAIGTGYQHVCALLNTKAVKCWGWNTLGTLGIGTTQYVGRGSTDMGSNLVSVSLGSSFEVSKLLVGQNHNCALSTQGALKCWGDNRRGQLGLGDIISRGTTPSQMGDNLPVVQLGSNSGTVTSMSSGYAINCAAFSTNKVKCWGTSYNASLGLGVAEGTTIGDVQAEIGDALPYVNLGFTLP